MPIVQEHWLNNYDGCHMFNIVKKLKSLKHDLRKLTWKDGNIFEKVQTLKAQLRELQSKIDKDPHDKRLRLEESQCIQTYVDAMKEEEINDFGPYVHLIKKKLNTYEENLMVREVSDEEVKEAMFQIDSNKAPVPDGFSSLFFKKAWGVVGGHVCSAVKEFFKNGRMLREINSTLISLIPKIQTPEKYCGPVSECICAWKAHQDNILLSQELLKGYERKDRPNRVAMKIDIQKAYDTVNWKFLEDILKGFGFHGKMVKWIISCITIVSFSICVNVESFGYFKRGRGLRQGDPMSPYLFTLVMEIMSLIVQDKGSVCTLKDAIEEFRHVSGLKPNYDKSTIIFGSMNDKDRQDIMECVPFKVEKLPVRYLVGILQSFVTHRDLYNVRWNDSMVVKDIVSNGVCLWPEEWIDKYPSLTLNNIIPFNHDKVDETVWRSKCGKDGKFTIKQAYKDLCDSSDVVKWHKMIWFTQNIPKHSFILWIAVQNRLVTQDKVRRWGSIDMMVCPLCKKDMDSHQHLFFQCEYSAEVWERIKVKAGIQTDKM
ncbi:RNA-directed DNA polymerase, eukaryota, reverse transcriptase zinc-binding domain protein [Tanacetum coccineum]